MALLGVAPLAVALVAEQSAYEHFRTARQDAALPGFVSQETVGYIILTEADRDSERFTKIEKRIKQRRREDPNALINSSRSGLLTAPKPKIITLFPSTSVPKSGSPQSGYGDGSYRTVCVRLCDGFYWPIAYGGSRGDAYDDKETCESSCATEAKLFTVPVDGSMDEARDLKGKPYSRLKNAYRYRNEYVPSCKCKPDPWEQASLDRHKKYAELARSGKLASLERKSNRKKRRKQRIEAETTFVSYGTTQGAIASTETVGTASSASSIGASADPAAQGKSKKRKKRAAAALNSSSAGSATITKVKRVQQVIHSSKRLGTVGGQKKKRSSIVNEQHSDRR